MGVAKITGLVNPNSLKILTDVKYEIPKYSYEKFYSLYSKICWYEL